MPRPSDDEIMMEAYIAWKTVTVLKDKTFSRFASIVDECCRSARKALRDEPAKHSTIVSTGSVLVWTTRDDGDTVNHEICITPSYGIKAKL